MSTTPATYTIVFPYRCPALRVRATGVMKRYQDLPDAALFLMADRPDEVYQKMGTCDAARLFPWDHDGYAEVLTNPLCEVVETLS